VWRKVSSPVSYPWVPQAGFLRGWLKSAAESLFFTLFPSDCRLCGEPQLNISRLPVCPDCLAQVHPIRGKVCFICGERVFSAYAATDPTGQQRCPSCRTAKRPFGRAVAYGSYDGELRELIHLLKYNRVRPAANVLGQMLAEAIAALEPGFEQPAVLVIPVPLYRGKRHQRGFNQAELIARAALKAQKNDRLELANTVLRRTRETGSQIGLSIQERRENLRGAFAVPRAAEVAGREVLLVDDVYTTGATMSECAHVLQRAGAAQVWAATVARTLRLASPTYGIEPEEAEEGEEKESALTRAVGS
jgi:ComF family protein